MAHERWLGFDVFHGVMGVASIKSYRNRQVGQIRLVANHVMVLQHRGNGC
jgi:hypothetical protein